MTFFILQTNVKNCCTSKWYISLFSDCLYQHCQHSDQFTTDWQAILTRDYCILHMIFQCMNTTDTYQKTAGLSVLAKVRVNSDRRSYMSLAQEICCFTVARYCGYGRVCWSGRLELSDLATGRGVYLLLSVCWACISRARCCKYIMLEPFFMSEIKISFLSRHFAI